MPDASFTITLANNRLEKEGIEYLRHHATGFFYVDNVTRKLILDLLLIDRKYVRAFDMVYIPRFEGEVVTAETIQARLEEIILVEL
jgi:hypothetical protein